MKSIINKIRLHHMALILFSVIALFAAVNGISYSDESCGCAEHKSITQYNGKGILQFSEDDKLISFLQKGKNHFFHNRKESEYKQQLLIKEEEKVFICNAVCSSEFENSCKSNTFFIPLSYLTSQLLC